MQHKRSHISKAVYIFSAFFLITYAIFPAPYINISHQLFTFLYSRTARDAQERIGNGQPFAAFVTDLGYMVPLYVIARPPQTPYDFFITKAPVGYDEQKFSHYVYATESMPIGYIERMYSAVYVVTLFSAPKSREQFSVGGFVGTGVGEGGGSFSVQVPAGIPVIIGEPIIHQATGAVVGAVAAVEDLPEKNIQKVAGVLHGNLFETTVLYVPHGARAISVTKEAVDKAIEQIHSSAKDEYEEFSENDGSDADENKTEEGTAVNTDNSDAGEEDQRENTETQYNTEEQDTDGDQGT